MGLGAPNSLVIMGALCVVERVVDLDVGDEHKEHKHTTNEQHTHTQQDLDVCDAARAYIYIYTHIYALHVT